MKRILIVALTLIYSQIALSALATPEGKPMTMMPMQHIEVAQIDSNGQLDTFRAYPNEVLDEFFTGNIDSLVNDYYVRKVFNLDSIPECSVPENDLIATEDGDLITDTTEDLPDSILISKLGNINSFIDLSFNGTVKEMIRFYTKKRKPKIETMLGLTSFYFPMIEEIFDRYQLPLELKYMAVIESALNPRAISRVGAAGMWQFMYRTGKLYDLEVNSYVDERYDPVKSTEAAARYLRDLYNIYHDWHLVIAAYNCGPGNINRAIARTGGKQDYWEIYYRLPKETRGYVPGFIAASYTVSYYKDYGLIPKEPVFNIATDTIMISSYLNLNQVASQLNLDIQLIRDLNPIFKKDIIPAKPDKQYALRLPEEAITKYIEMEKDIFAINRDDYFPNNQIKEPVALTSHSSSTCISGKKKIYHTVKSGDIPGKIAEKYHVRLSDLKKWNNMRSNMLRIGQKLVVYVPEGKASVKKTTDAVTETTTNSTNDLIADNSPGSDSGESFVYYTVQNGDNLWDIARQYPGTSAEEIRQLNDISNTKGLYIGQKLKILKKQ
jgi:membrane-bound lytic murein transglycosylase D